MVFQGFGILTQNPNRILAKFVTESLQNPYRILDKILARSLQRIRTENPYRIRKESLTQNPYGIFGESLWNAYTESLQNPYGILYRES